MLQGQGPGKYAPTLFASCPSLNGDARDGGTRVTREMRESAPVVLLTHGKPPSFTGLGIRCLRWHVSSEKSPAC